jgi:carbonic anhydrase
VLKNKAVLPGHLPELVDAFKPAVISAQTMQSGDLLENAIAKNVRQQVTRLKTSPPVIQNLYADNKIDVVGGVYDLATGKIMFV